GVDVQLVDEVFDAGDGASDLEDRLALRGAADIAAQIYSAEPGVDTDAFGSGTRIVGEGHGDCGGKIAVRDEVIMDLGQAGDADELVGDKTAVEIAGDVAT